jgi:hypothetical protein
MPKKAAIQTRLDKAIRRLQAQRLVLDGAAAGIAAIPGIVVELGLGNGRSYDHLRKRLPGREIFVFERKVQAHPDTIPPDDFLILGNLEDTLPAARARFAGRAALVHSDIGTGDDTRNAAFAAWLGPHIAPLVAPGGIVASDQKLDALAKSAIPLPEGVAEGRYYLYRIPL